MHPITMTYRQGTTILRLVNASLPEKINDELKFPWDIRSTFDRNARQLFKALKKASPGFKAKVMMPVFGDPNNWKKVESRKMKVPDGFGGMREIELPGHSQGPEYTVIELNAEVTLEDVNSQARDAIGLILILLSHPDSKEHLSPADQDEIVWPLAEQLEIVPWLEEKVGISKGQAMQVQYTPKKVDAAPSATVAPAQT